MTQLELFEALEPPTLSGYLAVADEGNSFVHLDMHTLGHVQSLRITVTRNMLQIYAQKFLEAANRPVG